ncbi:MAG: hypothetical protein K0M45_06050 [Candidatus Paracaedibacteraceae bacterium]|nr:hypothetical protein [Candidatus Paracaedibacteraceae bacterium]
MKFYAYSLILSAVMINSSVAKSLHFIELPQVVRALINNNRKDCYELKDLNEEPGQYTVGNAISHLRYLNHDIEYITYCSAGAHCTASASFDQGNGGYHLIIFANPNKKWTEVYNGQVIDYKFVLTHFLDKKVPANLIIRRKGMPGFTVEEIEYEWGIKGNNYIQKSIKEDIYHQRKGR